MFSQAARLILPPVAPEASIVPETVILPESAESVKNLERDTPSTEMSPVLTRKLRSRLNPPASNI